MRPIVHFEIPAEDKNRAQEFYKNVFDWQFKEWPTSDTSYTGVRTAEVDENQMIKENGRINGGMVSKEILNSISLTVESDDAESLVKEIEKHGGKMHGEPIVYPTAGTVYYVEDTEGNIISIWQKEKSAN